MMYESTRLSLAHTQAGPRNLVDDALLSISIRSMKSFRSERVMLSSSAAVGLAQHRTNPTLAWNFSSYPPACVALQCRKINSHACTEPKCTVNVEGSGSAEY